MQFKIKTSLLFLISIILFHSNISVATKPRNPVVHTPLGRVKGSITTSRLGKTIYSFRGIKYAKIPERFEVSKPVAPWHGVFDASEEGPACYQQNNTAAANMSEDCLALNIYTNKLPSIPEEVRRPVLVFFHPGAFNFYSGQSFVFGPQYLLDKDVVLVTVNYRLATLGWISTGDHRAPGNLGMKDQVLALKFVRDNIATFGGDPSSVTISGYSAGATSTVLHIVSPMSKGLFHRAIVMSASPTVPDLLPTDQLHLAKKQAIFLNCTTEDLDEMIACMKEKPAEEFAKSRPKFNEYYGDPVLVWSPVVEPEVPGVERFLPEQPEDILRSKRFNDVPVITGVTKDEFGSIVPLIIQNLKKGILNQTFFEDTNRNWDTIAPISFQYQRNTERSKYISRELRQFYFKDQPISLENVDAFGLLYSDALIGYAVNRFAKLMAANSRNPVYYYKFSYQGRYSFAMVDDPKKPYGVVHHDDMQYIFYMAFQFPYFEKDAPEISTLEKMTEIWSHFMTTGTPIPQNDQLFKDVSWEPLTVENNAYLDINESMTMQNNMFADRYSTWDRIFPFKPISV